MEHLLSAAEALELFIRDRLPFLDVRSEGEYLEGHLPGTISLPILNNAERHLVGIRYKEAGKESAIELATQLTLSSREQRTQGWRHQIPGGRGLLMCWRGGLRSKTATSWILESAPKDFEIYRVEGGFKAIRSQLLQLLETAPELLILSGFTGGDKTRLIQELSCPKIDLEGLANHRGSSFGAIALPPQPSQVTFENALALEILKITERPILVEDESLNIGKVTLPRNFKDKMRESPFVVLEASVRQRAENIYREYIEVPVSQGVGRDELEAALNKSLLALQRRLGGLLTQQIAAILRQAFETNSRDTHLEWIESLLVNYYDKGYAHAFSRYTRPLLHKGDYESCRQFLLKKYASQKP